MSGMRAAVRTIVLTGSMFAALAVGGRAWAAEDPRPAAPKTVYGVDNRREVYGLTRARAAAAAATVALVDSFSIRDRGNGTSALRSEPLGRRYGLCAGERFYYQPTAAYCSGVLVGPDLVLTAGHCVDAVPLNAARFVFGYRKLDVDTVRTVVPNGMIYRAKKVVASEVGAADYALIRLDREVRGRKPVTIQRRGQVALNTPLYVIGHPSGLPEKFAAGAKVLNTDAPEYFTANLDTFGGNSGSPVFNAVSNRVIGILVRGANDYRKSGACNVVNTLSDAVGQEDVTRTTGIAKFIP